MHTMLEYSIVIRAVYNTTMIFHYLSRCNNGILISSCFLFQHMPLLVSLSQIHAELLHQKVNQPSHIGSLRVYPNPTSRAEEENNPLYTVALYAPPSPKLSNLK